MIVAVTGADGFLGWHVRCAALAAGVDTVPITRDDFGSGLRLADIVKNVDAVIHLAGPNRATEDELRNQHPQLARAMVEALDRSGRALPIVIGNSIQSGNGTAFGQGKAEAAAILKEWGAESKSAVTDVRLPNLFGEHGRPNYNSVFATFAHQVCAGEIPTVLVDRELQLLAAQDAADLLLGAVTVGTNSTVFPEGRRMTVSHLRDVMLSFASYLDSGLFPELADRDSVAFFNAFRSYAFGRSPMHPAVHRDGRGHLFECIRSPLSGSQVFFSTTNPGAERGNHFHRRKVERFAVLAGEGEISLRRVLTGECKQFRVSGSEPCVVDIPVLWTHSITNVGSSSLSTLFWANELYDPDEPDTTFDAVREHTA